LLAEEVRRYMAKLGFRTFQELIGRTDKLRFSPAPSIGKAQLLNFDPILKNALELRPGASIRAGTVSQDYKMEERLVSGYQVPVLTCWTYSFAYQQHTSFLNANVLMPNTRQPKMCLWTHE
jgi:hypothetical protein